MSLFGALKTKDINEGIKEFRACENAVLLDVRTPEEYASGHIEDSKNLPLQNIDSIGSVAADKTAAIFVHCQSGARSAMAAAQLKRMGYTNVKDIGGIMDYKGKVVV